MPQPHFVSAGSLSGRLASIAVASGSGGADRYEDLAGLSGPHSRPAGSNIGHPRRSDRGRGAAAHGSSPLPSSPLPSSPLPSSPPPLLPSSPPPGQAWRRSSMVTPDVTLSCPIWSGWGPRLRRGRRTAGTQRLRGRGASSIVMTGFERQPGRPDHRQAPPPAGEVPSMDNRSSGTPRRNGPARDTSGRISSSQRGATRPALRPDLGKRPASEPPRRTARRANAAGLAEIWRRPTRACPAHPGRGTWRATT